MEVLVHWFSNNLAQFISPGGCGVYHLHDSDPGVKRRASGAVPAEDFSGKGHSAVCDRKYYPDSVYSAFYPEDL